MAPQVGLEPTTLRLTAECSAIELLRNNCGCTAIDLALGRNDFYNKGREHGQGDRFVGSAPLVWEHYRFVGSGSF